MTDREKVVKGLECCMGKGQCCGMCDNCPYNTDKMRCDLATLHQEALELLKAQEPRVMTLEEVDALGDDDIVWLECLYAVDGTNKTTMKPAIYQPDNSSPDEDGYYCVVSSWGESGFYHKDNYMGDWRCWTSRPTDEQREAIPWN